MSIIALPKQGGEVMPIHWFDAKEREGQASLTTHYITLNTVASVPFELAYKVQVGINEEGNLVVEPLLKERVERGDLDEYNLQDIALKKSYSRISSSSLMRHIVEVTGLPLGESATSYKTEWNEKENLLIIKIKE
jgi:hypothetical protein